MSAFDEGPIPFIQVDGRKLAVHPRAREVLSELRGTVGVCAVAGVYRTGERVPAKPEATAARERRPADASEGSIVAAF